MKEFAKKSVFPIGNENSAFAQYFDGKSYLNMLSTCLLYTSPSPRD